MQLAFNKIGKFPTYEVLSKTDREVFFYKKFLKELGEKKCLNTLKGGMDVSSEPNREVHRKISIANKKWAATPRGKMAIKKATKAAATARKK